MISFFSRAAARCRVIHFPRGRELRPPLHSPLGEFLETAPDVRVRVRGGAAAAEAERAAILALDVVAADAQHNAQGAVVAVVADVGALATCDR